MADTKIDLRNTGPVRLMPLDTANVLLPFDRPLSEYLTGKAGTEYPKRRGIWHSAAEFLYELKWKELSAAFYTTGADVGQAAEEKRRSASAYLYSQITIAPPPPPPPPAPAPKKEAVAPPPPPPAPKPQPVAKAPAPPPPEPVAPKAPPVEPPAVREMPKPAAAREPERTPPPKPAPVAAPPKPAPVQAPPPPPPPAAKPAPVAKPVPVPPSKPAPTPAPAPPSKPVVAPKPAPAVAAKSSPAPAMATATAVVVEKPAVAAKVAEPKPVEPRIQVPDPVAPPSEARTAARAVPIAEPAVREAPKPVEREVPKPVEREIPKPVERETPRPVEREIPKPVEREVPKPVEKPRTVAEPPAPIAAPSFGGAAGSSTSSSSSYADAIPEPSGGIPMAAKIGAPVVLLAAIGWFVFSGGDDTKKKAAPSGAEQVTVGEQGWVTEWASDPGGSRRGRQLTLYRPSMSLSDYKFKFAGQIESKALGWVFRAADTKNYYAMKVVITRPGPIPSIAITRLAVVDGRESSYNEKPVALPLRADSLINVELDVKGPQFTVYVQGQPVDVWTDNRLKSGAVGFMNERDERARTSSVQFSFPKAGSK